MARLLFDDVIVAVSRSSRIGATDDWLYGFLRKRQDKVVPVHPLHHAPFVAQLTQLACRELF